MQRRPAHTIGGLADNHARVCANVFAHPRRADVHDADESVRNCNGVTHTHGGLTPAALGSVRLCTAKIVILSGERSLQQRQERGASAPRGFATATAPAFLGTAMVVCRDFAAAYLQVHFPNSHGGLTPAALVNVRFCTAKIVILPGELSLQQRQERGGVSPPWFRKRAYKCVSSTLPTMFARPHPRRADGGHCCSSVRLLPGNDPFLQHAIGITQPRRGDTRRSCECAFVHRKNRHFSGERSLQQHQERGA
jgi:hypothetical protein